VISLEKLNTIKSIDKDTRTAVVEPGVVLADLTKAVEAAGLFYPPDPTEWSCQVGGTVATNASGARSFKYGATREFVKAMKIILADGSELNLRRDQVSAGADGFVRLMASSGRQIEAKTPSYPRPRVRKNVSGYFNAPPLDAIDLFIGSEGTLGVIAEIELGLLPKPQGFLSSIAFFEREADMLAFVDEAKEMSFAKRNSTVSRNEGGTPVENRPSVIDATLIEYFDERALKFISERFPETPSGMAGAIFFEQETTSETEDAVFEAWNELLEKHEAAVEESWFAIIEQDQEKMRAFRHALPVSVNEFIARHKQRKVGTDMAVPDNRFSGFLKFYKDTLEESGLDYVIFGHIGDCHLHANLLPKDEREAEKARRIYGRCVAQAIMLGGTVSAEHGIGKLKRKYLDVMMGERYLNEMAALKKAFDPNCILGRGNMFDERLCSSI
jgi:D-lactate dehydrogenase (cytochrome)